MGTGQMMLIIGALALLATLTLSINSTIISKYELIYEAEATVDAISIGQAMLDEALAKDFDEKTIGTKINNPTSLTNYPLGRDANDAVLPAIDSLNVPGTFSYNSALPTKIQFSSVGLDDFDDYNRYMRVVYTPRMGRFIVQDTVFYVQDSSPDNPSSTRTYQKKMVVKVWHQNINYPIVVSDLAIYRRYF
jgi:hypothetical protein